jgi:hypothetical protein
MANASRAISNSLSLPGNQPILAEDGLRILLATSVRQPAQLQPIGTQKAAFISQARKLRPVPSSSFRPYPIQVSVNCAHRNHQSSCNLLGRFPASHQRVL